MISAGQNLWYSSRMAGGATYYVDADATGPGDGSLADPWLDFTTVNSLAASGDLDGATVKINRGTTTYDQLQIGDTVNVTVEPYGSGANPIIDGSTVLAGSWSKAGNIYTHSAATLQHNILVDGNHMTKRTDAALALTADNATYVTGGFLTVYSSTQDLSLATETRYATEARPIQADGADGLTIKNIDVQMGTNTLFRGATGANGNAINTLISGGAYRWAGAAADNGNGITFNGTSHADKATGNIVEDVDIYENDTGITGNGLELNDQDRFIFRGRTTKCIIRDNLGNGIEIFEECDNGLFDRVLIYGNVANGVKIYSQNSSDSTDNLFRNIAYKTDRTWTQTGTQTGSPFVVQEAGTNNRFINCSYYGNSNSMFWIKAGTASIANSNMFLSKATATSDQHIRLDTGVASVAAIDYNTYETGAGANWWRENGTAINVFATWQGTAGSPDANAQDSATLLYTDPTAAIPDLSLVASSQALNFADSTITDAPTVDIDGNTRTPDGSDKIDCGAYERA